MIWSIAWRVSACDRRLGGGDVALALGRGLLAHLALELGAGAARALDDLAGLAARLGELLLVLLEQPLGLLARVLGGLQVLAHDRPALLDQSRERTEGVLAQDQERDEEDDQRPDHQPGEGLDEVARLSAFVGRE